MASKRTYLREVNPQLICPLCRGYLIDATTVVECLHSFCRSCILKHLRKNAQCPSCKHLLNTAKPNIKADKALQDIVYKLVPGLYHKEMRKRREFYSKHPEHADSATPEQRGEDVSGRLIFAPEDAISLSLEYLPIGADPLTLLSNSNSDVESSQTTSASGQKQKANNPGTSNRRYLQCPALVTIAHLKKFLGLKYSVDMTRYNIDICHRRAPLPEHWTLMDVAYIFAWKRNAPIRFFYRITQEEQQLEAPPNDRPSTPGLGASQPVTNEQANEPEVKESKPEREDESANQPSEQKCEARQPEVKLLSSPQKVCDIKRNDSEKTQEFFAKRSAPCPKEVEKETDSNEITGEKTPPPMVSSKPDDAMKQVKTPIKIMKNSEGRYQVLRGSSLPTRNVNSSEEKNGTVPVTTKTSPSPVPALTPAEFSVVSIGDGANSNGVKITLKQCSPGTTNNSAKKPKVISNVLLRNSNDDKTNSVVVQMKEIQKQEKQKRKVTFMDAETSPPLPNVKQPKKSPEQPDKKQFLQSFRLTAKQAAAAAAQSNNQQQGKVTNLEQPSSNEKTVATVDDQTKNVLKSSEASKDLSDKQTTVSEESTVTSPTKKRQTEAKTNSTNIADRLNESKQVASGEKNSPQTQAISSSNEKLQQPIDVYAFPNDPPSTLPAGAVKRKCPPGVPIFEIRKKHQQYQAGKRTGVNTARGGAAVKCYRNQSTKPMVYAKPPASPARPLQNLPSPISNASPTNPSVSPASSPNAAVSSTSPKSASSQPSVMISNDTRNLLDGCGLNIPASLSITLTAPKSPNRGGDSQLELRGSKDGQSNSNLDKLNPSITLNDKSVDPRVLKALKAGQIRMPMANAKTKARQQSVDQSPGPPVKRKKDEPSPPQPRNILDLSGAKKMDLNPLRIPTPPGKFKAKPPNWSQVNSPKISNKDDVPNYSANGQVVTLTGGQRFYRAPPGSLTPAVHRIGDIPTPSRAPVYAPPCFSSPPSNNRPAPNLSSVFPSLRSLYALSQAPSLEQFHMDSRMRMSAAAAAKDGNSGATNNAGNQVNKSHIAAQCAPVKPARSSVGSFAVPIAKQSIGGISIKMAGGNSGSKGAAVSSARDSEMSSSSSTESSATDQKAKKTENTKEAPAKTDCEQSENCASTTEEGNSQQGAASPRVTSTASPSPPPSVSEVTANALETSSKEEKRPPSSGPEVTSSNKSPESPDSSSVVTESMGNLVDSTKPAMEKDRETSPVKNTEVKNVNDEQTNDTKSSNKVETSEFKKPMTSEALQKRFLAAFPSNEWANNPIAAEQFGNFLKSLSSMQAEAQSKNAKAAE